MTNVEFRLLGPVEAQANGVTLDLGGPRPRAVLALLLLEANRVVSSDRLIEGVWGEEPPAAAAGTLQSYVSRLRRALGADVLRSTPAGYELSVDPDRIDVFRFQSLVDEGRERLATRDARGAAETLTEALSLWRGEAFGDLAYEAWAAAEASRLEELRAAAVEDRVEAELALGRHAELVAELEVLVARYPLRERLRGQLMLALYRSGRQADALEAYRQAREALVEELGLDPGRALQELERAILRQDPALEAPERAADDGAPADQVLGREAELATLASALEEALRGRGDLAVVTGEPGIGKTRLADEVAALAASRKAAVVWGRCWEAGGAPAYWPWAQAFRASLRTVDHDRLRRRLGPGLDELAATMQLLREAFPDVGVEPPPAGEQGRFALFQAATTFLGAVAEEHPLVVVLDDLHAADEPSLLFLRFLAPQLDSMPVLVVALWRDAEPVVEGVRALLAEVERAASPRVRLGGLPFDAVAALVEQATERTPSTELVREIHADTQGNPLFVAEVARMLTAEDALETAPAARIRLPQGVRSVIGRRLDGLSEECREVLTYAAVVGREFDLPTLARTGDVDRDTVLDALDEAIGARVVADVPEGLGRFRFAHALIRETIYHDLTPARRMRLHGRVGRALEQAGAGANAHVAELAHHFFEAAPAGEADKAAEYAERAARRALEAFGFEEAVRLFRLALRANELAGTKDEHWLADTLLGLGDAQARSGDVTGARDAFLRAAELARREGLREQLGLAALGVGGRFVWGRQSADPELVPLLEEALAAVGEEETPLRARLLARLAGALRDEPSREPRASLSAEAVALARRLGDPATLAFALESRWDAAWWPENPEERLAIATELVDLSSRIRDRERAFEAHNHRAATLYELGRPAEADAELEVARRIADELRQPAQQWVVAAADVMRALAEGRLEDAEPLAARALLVGREAVGADAVLTNRIHLFLLRREQGRLPEVERELAASLVEHRARWPVRCLLAHLYALLGRDRDAREALAALADDAFAALPVDNEWLFALSFLPEVCTALDDAVTAAALYELLLPHADRIAVDMGDGDTGSVERPLGSLAALLGRNDVAAQHFEAAIERNDALGYRPWAAHARHEYARLLLAAGDDRGRELAAEAVATASELGLTALAAAAVGSAGGGRPSTRSKARSAARRA